MNINLQVFSIDPTPVVRIKYIASESGDWVSIDIDCLNLAVFRPTDADLRAWLQDLRDQVDAALATPSGASPPAPSAEGQSDADEILPAAQVAI